MWLTHHTQYIIGASKLNQLEQSELGSSTQNCIEFIVTFSRQRSMLWIKTVMDEGLFSYPFFIYGHKARSI